MKRILISILLSVYTIDYQLVAQNLQLGGLQGEKPLILTPSDSENQKLQGKNPYKIDYLGIKPHAEENYLMNFRLLCPKNGIGWLFSICLSKMIRKIVK
jgi:hypothetical protein